MMRYGPPIDCAVPAEEWDSIRAAFQEEVEAALVKACAAFELATGAGHKMLTPGHEAGPELVREFFDKIVAHVGVYVEEQD